MAETKWRSYEEVSTFLLNSVASELGLSRVEGKQPVHGTVSDTTWVLDAKGVLIGSEAFVIIECRRHTTRKLDQEQIAGLAYRIRDTCAVGGIVVTPIGLQSGADKVAQAENVITVELHPDSTPTDFMMKFLDRIFVGIRFIANASDDYQYSLTRSCDDCGDKFEVRHDERVCSRCSGGT